MLKTKDYFILCLLHSFILFWGNNKRHKKILLTLRIFKKRNQNKELIIQTRYLEILSLEEIKLRHFYFILLYAIFILYEIKFYLLSILLNFIWEKWKCCKENSPNENLRESSVLKFQILQFFVKIWRILKNSQKFMSLKIFENCRNSTKNI